MRKLFFITLTNYIYDAARVTDPVVSARITALGKNPFIFTKHRPGLAEKENFISKP